jgi:hypothetical protein
VPLELSSSLWKTPHNVPVDRTLAHFAGLAYGDGYPVWGEIRVVTANELFAEKLMQIVNSIANQFQATTREYVRPDPVSNSIQHNVVLNSTLVRRALFNDLMQPDYGAIHSIAMEPDLAAEFQAGFTDAEGSLLTPTPIDSPHGRIFAAVNSDRRLLGIARLSLVYQIRIEPGSVSTRLSSKKGRSHFLNGVEFVTRKNSYCVEILSSGKKKWLQRVGSQLWHPSKSEVAKVLLRTYNT